MNARITGKIERAQFVVEKLIYESLPNFPVTAACYVPNGIKERTPTVILVCGHWDAGKSQSTCQSVCIDLANNGFIVLAIDPLGQGERAQYFENGQRVVGSAVYEHIHGELQFFLQGASIARHFIWDVIRGIDYLETRPDVDASRIGLAGNSGDGTQTCPLMMSEPRLAAAMPCTFVMSLEIYFRTGQAQDSELRAAKSSQVTVDMPSAKTVFDLNLEYLNRESRTTLHELRVTIREALGINQAGDRNEPIHARTHIESVANGYRVERLFFFSAPDIVVTGLIIHPRGAKSDEPLTTTMLLLEDGTNDAIRERPRIESVLGTGWRRVLRTANS